VIGGIVVGDCAGCGRLAFPVPAVCHRCGSTVWTSCRVEDGVVEEFARVQHAVGGTAGDVILASVRLHAGPLVIARIPDGVTAGTEVRVSSTAAGIRAEPTE
jgi:uncharacterized OB-fold protein